MVYRIIVKPLRRIYRFLFIFTVLLVFVGCGGTWDLRSDINPSKVDITDSNMAIIEMHPTRRSPKIQTFRHLDLGIYKETAGSGHNETFARNRVITPPGKIQIVVNVHRLWIYFPEIEFTASSKHKYFITWVCNPYPFLSIADAQTDMVVAMETFCPDCNGLIGQPLKSSTECSTSTMNQSSGDFHPLQMKPKDMLDISKWNVEIIQQQYKNLCYAAEHGNTTAMMRLGFHYRLGSGGRKSGLNKDPARAYIWYRFAEDAGDVNAAWYATSIKEQSLSTTQAKQAEQLLAAWQPGQCEKDLQTMPVFNPDFSWIHNRKVPLW